MLKFISLIQAYNTKEDGATAIEYGLIAAGVALAIATVVFLIGTDLTTKFTQVDTVLK